MTEKARLTRGSISGHLVGQTAPTIVGVAAMMSVGLVDSYFIGQLGSVELAAVGFIFPITVALVSLGVGVMVGVNSVVARAIGEGDDDKAARRANFGIVFAVTLGLVLGVLLFALLGPLFRLMNAPESLLPLIGEYMRPFALGFPLQLAIMGLNGVLRAQGEARKTSYVSLVFAGVNWILDPILITGAFGITGFGIAGAAYATVAGWAVSIVLAIVLLRRTHLPLNPMLLRNCNLVDPATSILKVAVPAAFSNAINPIGLSVLTALVALEGQAAVAGFGAAGRLQSFAVVPLLALSGSIGSIVGQNWGAREFGRARSAAMGAFGFCLAYGLAIAVALFAAGQWFAGFFTDDPAVIRQFDLYLRIAAWGYAGFGLLIVGNGVLNAVDKAGWSLAQSCFRVLAVMLPVAVLLPASWGSSAIFTAELTANLAGGCIAVLVVLWVLAPGKDGGR